MKKVKLPRKRKKEYIKINGFGNYLTLTILGELLQEENRKYANRYYSYTECPPSKIYPNGVKPIKRW